jgi:glyoxylate/hydroxypyruvate reductase A
VTRSRDAMQARRMAQYVALAVLRWHRELPRYEAQQVRREWARHPAESERAWTIGLLGFGTLGSAVADALIALGYPVRAWVRTARDAAPVECFAGAAGLAEFLAGTRVLVCLLPLTGQTRGLLSDALFAQLPRGAFVINVSRGAVLNEADLLAALATEHLGGAALDVYAREPLPATDPLWVTGRIVATPHIAAAPRAEVVAQQVLDNLARARRGEPLCGLVDRDRGY